MTLLDNIEQNLFIEASAGCGKTYTLEQLTLKLIRSGIKFEEIVIVTFTKKGALDLKQRIVNTLKNEGIHVNPDEGMITTIHGFALKQLQDNPFYTQKLYENVLTQKGEEALLSTFVEKLDHFLPYEIAKKALRNYSASWKVKDVKADAILGPPFTQFLKVYKTKKGLYTFDDLIHDFNALIEVPEALERVKGRYKVGIIDEFQDTDPLQWGIFSRLFLHDKGRLYVVGDPKQSIYAFRNGDIYTYLDAKKTMGQEAQRTLSTNYRSDPELIEKLNRLFQTDNETSFLPLPRLNTTLAVPRVSAPEGKAPYPPFSEWDKLQFVAFSQGEETLFNFAAQAIQKLRQEGVALNEIALLVDQNKLGKELEAYLKQWNIPTHLIQDKNEVENEILTGWESLIKGISSPCQDSALKEALVSPFFNWKPEALDALADLEFKEAIVWEFMSLKTAYEKGKPALVRALLNLRLQEHSVLETLKKREDAEAWLEFLYQEEQEEDPINPPPTSFKNGVEIITFHKSKGLEYEVVIPIGLGIPRRLANKTEEELAEKLRLVYVILTRAKRLLFLPLHTDKMRSDLTTLLHLFLKQTLKETSVEAIASAGFSVIEATHMPPTFVDLPPIEGDKGSESYTPQFQIKEVLSFTRIKPEKKAIKSAETIPDEGLPKGAETGILFHELFEKIPLSLPKKAQSAQEYLPFVQNFVKNSLWEPWKETIASLLERAFNTPLPGADFLLKEVSEETSFREVEFFEGQNEGYMTGVIDWLFEHKGEFYIVDWKTNALSDFTPETLQKTMEEESYTLQAKIYNDAASRYLARFGNKKIKGIYYLFVRGGVAWKVI
jgi:exodeoxyribonuclease V beta subunit